MKKKTLPPKAERVEKVQKIKKVVDDTQKVVGDVDNITKIISTTLYITCNLPVFSQAISIS